MKHCAGSRRAPLRDGLQARRTDSAPNLLASKKMGTLPHRMLEELVARILGARETRTTVAIYVAVNSFIMMFHGVSCERLC